MGCFSILCLVNLLVMLGLFLNIFYEKVKILQMKRLNFLRVQIGLSCVNWLLSLLAWGKGSAAVGLANSARMGMGGMMGGEASVASASLGASAVLMLIVWLLIFALIVCFSVNLCCKYKPEMENSYNEDDGVNEVYANEV